MPEWLTDSVAVPHELELWLIAVRLAAALVLGCGVAGVYWLTLRQSGRSAMRFLATLVLLTVLIGMVTLVIGDSVARAFSLVGALAIVRFRTVVEDTRDTAFVIFAVVVGMSAGTGHVSIALVGFPLVLIAALLFRPPPQGAEATLHLRLGVGHDPDVLLKPIVDKHVTTWKLSATATARQGAALDVTYRILLRPAADALEMVSELNRLEGVQEVEYKANE